MEEKIIQAFGHFVIGIALKVSVDVKGQLQLYLKVTENINNKYPPWIQLSLLNTLTL